MQFNCASCGYPILRLIDARQIQRPGKVAIPDYTAWLIHDTCTDAWVEQYGSHWQYHDLKPRRVVEAGGAR
jgi:hypothetical protein